MRIACGWTNSIMSNAPLQENFFTCQKVNKDLGSRRNNRVFRWRPRNTHSEEVPPLPFLLWPGRLPKVRSDFLSFSLLVSTIIASHVFIAWFLLIFNLPSLSWISRRSDVWTTIEPFFAFLASSWLALHSLLFAWSDAICLLKYHCSHTQSSLHGVDHRLILSITAIPARENLIRKH